MGFENNYFEDNNRDDIVNKSKEKKEKEVLFKKYSKVISDGINLEENPKRIPGATIRYFYEIENNSKNDLKGMKINEKFNLDIFEIIGNDNFEIYDYGKIISKEFILKAGRKIIFTIDCIIK